MTLNQALAAARSSWASWALRPARWPAFSIRVAAGLGVSAEEDRRTLASKEKRLNMVVARPIPALVFDEEKIKGFPQYFQLHFMHFGHNSLT